MTETFTAFVTKYALTDGIQERTVRDCFSIDPHMVADTRGTNICYHKGDWHRTNEEAVKRAEQMRIAKIASVKKQLARLETMKFG